jgi:hypothetical protein
MECIPGGLCVFLEHYIKRETTVSNYYKIYHATEGIQKMPDYYFISLDEARELRYYINREQERGSG